MRLPASWSTRSMPAPTGGAKRKDARPQVEELGVVVGVVDREVLGRPALPVAALGEHLGRGLAQDALVGHGDAQHGTTPSVSGWNGPRAGSRGARSVPWGREGPL